MVGNAEPAVVISEIDGIRIRCEKSPASATFRVTIGGLGHVYEYLGTINQNSVTEFFYPYVNADKEYTVRLEFYTTPSSETLVGWKDVTVTPAGGLGEVRITRAPSVNIDSNGNFVITPPVFSDESKIPGWDFKFEIYNGKSWHYATSGWNWLGEIIFKNSDLGKLCNVYEELTTNSAYRNDERINFVSLQPRVVYKDKQNKQWQYRWDSTEKENLNIISKNEYLDLPDWNTVTSADLWKFTGAWSCAPIVSYWTYSTPNDMKDTTQVTLTFDTTGHIQYVEQLTTVRVDGNVISDEQITAMELHDGFTYTVSTDRKTVSHTTDTYVSAYAYINIIKLNKNLEKFKVYQNGFADEGSALTFTKH